MKRWQVVALAALPALLIVGGTVAGTRLREIGQATAQAREDRERDAAIRRAQDEGWLAVQERRVEQLERCADALEHCADALTMGEGLTVCELDWKVCGPRR